MHAAGCKWLVPGPCAKARVRDGSGGSEPTGTKDKGLNGHKDLLPYRPITPSTGEEAVA